jgi:hypothetical protein
MQVRHHAITVDRQANVCKTNVILTELNIVVYLFLFVASEKKSNFNFIPQPRAAVQFFVQISTTTKW